MLHNLPPFGACASKELSRAAYERMDAAISTDSAGLAKSAHQELRDKLAARYGLRGEYVGASTVALVMGLGRTTVHDQVKAGRFVIPHRLANRKPLFLIDDLVAWMQGKEWPVDTAAEKRDLHARDEPITFDDPKSEVAFMRACAKMGLGGPRDSRPPLRRS